MSFNVTLNVGKLTTKSPKYAGEAGFVQQIRAQMREIESIFKDVINQIEDATPDLLLDVLQPTFEKAAYYCPKKTGALVNSEYLEVSQGSSKKRPHVSLGFAKGGNPPYAVYVHEITSYNHEPPTRSKFLQAAVYEDLGNIQERIIANYQQFMGGGYFG